MTQFNQFRLKFRSGGFRFPREHGLSSIWVGAVVLGIGLSSLYSSIDLIGLLISLAFVSSIFFSSDSLMMQVKRKTDAFEWMPPLAILVTSSGMIIWNHTFELLMVMGLMGGLTLGYLFVSKESKKQTPTELILGTVSMGLLTTCIYLVIVGSVTSKMFTEILVINWVFIGVSIAHIQYVETLRDKIPIRNFLLSWIVILGSLCIPLYLQIVELVILLPLIEPTIFVFLQVYRKEKIKKSKRNIKIIGIQLMFRLWVVVILLLVFYLFIIPV
ncbi:MAG: hypothetical protein KAT16_07145 [Candidatus Heimdallarchaeota archaeon]|nr:hypothetical protein [Candidatus Heimdallarchaeota archaeon]